MEVTTDSSNAVIRPPIARALACVAGVGVDWLSPMPFLPTSFPSAWLGGRFSPSVFVRAMWAIVTIRKAGARVETYKPTTTIVASGPYSFTRNPIYIGMFLGQIGLAVGFNSLWLLATLVPFYLVIRYGVVAREEAYLERKFGDICCSYRSRARRWL